MFCHACGVPIRSDQPFCSSCGTPVNPQRPREARVQQHVRTLGILWIAFSVLRALPFLGVLGFWPFLRRFTWGLPFPFAHLVGFVVGLGVIMGFAGIAAGWGLLERQLWARPLALILGIISLLHFPLGTVLGIYTLWVLMPNQSEQEYRRMACS
ncbi:MAG TPA: zinc-ribbon domain-containing protein [Verrucomicrobiae bacterium]|nr:zinc-ribbon domain-containing protein [Verrucomicrobiae bacterium]